MIGKLDRNDLCWCSSGKKYKHCHQDIDAKIKQYKRVGCTVPGRHLLKSCHQIEGIRESGKVNTAVLDYLTDKIRVGMSTNEIDRLVYDRTVYLGGRPATLGFEGYPKSVCTSVNQVVCHGIPSDREILQEGDILNVDVCTVLNGYYSDSSRMFCLGEVSAEKRRLVEVAHTAISIGLSQAAPWNFLGDIGQAINDYVSSQGCSVVREIGGHGIGMKLHEDPYVSYVSRKGTEMLLVPGMVFTIEPMINLGTAEVVADRENGWIISTRDKLPSAQWEVTVLITDSGHEILAC